MPWKIDKEYDFIVGFTIFSPTGFKTMYRHFDKLETAQLFASNKNLKDNCKIYVDLDFYQKSQVDKNYISKDKINEKNKRIRKKIYRTLLFSI